MTVDCLQSARDQIATMSNPKRTTWNLRSKREPAAALEQKIECDTTDAETSRKDRSDAALKRIWEIEEEFTG